MVTTDPGRVVVFVVARDERGHVVVFIVVKRGHVGVFTIVKRVVGPVQVFLELKIGIETGSSQSQDKKSECKNVPHYQGRKEQHITL